LFITFTITVFVFSLIAALLIALLVALLFTVFMVGVALLFVLPTVFITTMAASFIFLWGMGGYYILKWFGEPGGAADGEAIGDKLNNLTGGRLGFLMEGAKENAVPNDHLHGGPKYEGNANGKAEKGNKEEKEGLIGGKDGPAKDVTKKAGDVTGAAKGATKHVDGVKDKAGGVTGTAKGAVSGVTGLG
jgi:energy-coupling factor transporter transmembrane protein EcfT